MKQIGLLGLILFLALFGVHSAQAQQPVVYAVLFYSPACSHCHYVITEVLPPLQEQYGEQLQILFIDVSQPDGSSLFYNACDALNVPDDRCGYVPTLVIGTKVLVGSEDIPRQMPTLVKDGLAKGGVAIPDIPGVREAYEAALNGEQASNLRAPFEPVSTTFREITWQDRFYQDQTGNTVAVGVLGALIVGLAAQLGYGARLFSKDEKRHWTINQMSGVFVLGVAMATTVIAASLALKNSQISLPTLLAAGVALGMALVVWTIARTDRPDGQPGYTFPGWLLPVIACLGLMVAGYLAYVEVGENEAVCGAVGDCNTVQQSDYADLFGVIPIGLLGVAGYVMILVVWLLSRYTTGWIDDASQVILLGAALFGTVFSIYLTFLEPFVIGATCAWCLTSAMLMILILSLQAPAGWTAVNRLARRSA